MRETSEEVGVALHRGHYLGELPPVRARSREKIEPLKVAPFVFRIDGERPLTTPNYEVAEVIWLPLSELVSPERKTDLTLHHEGQTFRMPAIQVNEHKIWGLTYGIISSLLAYLAAGDD